LALSRRQTRVDHSQNVTCVCLEGRKKKRLEQKNKKIKTLNKKFDLMIFASEELLNYIARNIRKEGIFIYL
jgi:hypothetical protein